MLYHNCKNNVRNDDDSQKLMTSFLLLYLGVQQGLVFTLFGDGSRVGNIKHGNWEIEWGGKQVLFIKYEHTYEIKINV